MMLPGSKPRNAMPAPDPDRYGATMPPVTGGPPTAGVTTSHEVRKLGIGPTSNSGAVGDGGAGRASTSAAAGVLAVASVRPTARATTTMATTTPTRATIMNAPPG